MNTILHERRLEEYFCVLCYASFDFKKRQLLIANSGLPYPIRRSEGVSLPIQLPGVPLGSFPNTTYEEMTFDLKAGDLYVFCTDGIYEAEDHLGHEFGTSRLIKVIDRLADQPAQAIVDGIFEAVETFRDDGAAADDMTAVAMRITDLVSLDIQISFFQVQAQRHAVEDGDVANDALHLDMAALDRRAVAAAREHGHFARPVVHLVELERHAAGCPTSW